LTTGIPQEQLERIQPTVDALIEELRRYTLNLPVTCVPAVDYQVIQEDGE
jgi:hypothetical protein